MKYIIALTMEIDAPSYEDAQREAKHLAAGLGNSEEANVDLLTVANGKDAIIANLIHTEDIQDAIDNYAEPTACITVPDVVERIQQMYDANSHEDVKWAIQDIEETSRD